MYRLLTLIVAVWVAMPLGRAAEIVFDFSTNTVNQMPPGFRSTLSGTGKPGDWKIILDEVPPILPRILSNAPVVTKRPVLAQLSEDLTDEHTPMLIYEGESFGDFTLSVRFKNVRGIVEQMAGMAFRIQDEKNYYYIRASSLGSNIRFFKMVNGLRSAPIGPEIPMPAGVWHSLKISCSGNQIRCLLNENEVLPTMTDLSFNTGKIGFWTKSDSVSYFTDLKITYTPRETLAVTLVKQAMQAYPRVRNLRVYGRSNAGAKVVAASHPEDIGLEAIKDEMAVIERDVADYLKKRQTVVVTLPLHDRNGDTAAAIRVEMDSFAGQTEQNALARALPIVKGMEKVFQASVDPLF